MKLKIIISIIAGVAIMQFINTVTPAVSNLDHALSGRIESSPQFKNGKFNETMLRQPGIFFSLKMPEHLKQSCR
jgi:hypothetical protein